MSALTEIRQQLQASIGKYDAFALSPRTAPDLWGVEGLDEKATYYRRYVDGINYALDALDGKHDVDDAVSVISAEHAAASVGTFTMTKSGRLASAAFAEGLGHALDRIYRFHVPAA